VKKETGMQGLLSELRKRRRNQKGFTLIEMLVVISILGILAAIVTMSMVGITNTARSNAQKAEKQTVQVALDTMASDKELPQGAVCPAPGAPGTTFDSATDDMSIFPTSANPLYPNYLRIAKTQQQKYWCDTTGLVHGVATP